MRSDYEFTPIGTNFFPAQGNGMGEGESRDLEGDVVNPGACALASDYPCFTTRENLPGTGHPFSPLYMRRHTDGINVVFVDGHVQRFNYRQARPHNWQWDGTGMSDPGEFMGFQFWGWMQTKGAYPGWPNIPKFAGG